MKLFTVVPAFALVLSLAACERPNDLPAYHEEAATIVSYYAPRVDALSRRLDVVERDLKSLPAGPSGLDEANKRVAESRAQLGTAQGMVGPGGVKVKADALAKEGKLAELAAFDDESEEKLENITTEVTENLTAVEHWIALVRSEARGQAPQPAAPAAAPAPAEAPAPEQPAAPSATGSAAK